MSAHERSCPMTGREIVDRDFLEARARLLDIASTLDRLDRSSDGRGRDDFRIRALIEAARELQSEAPGRCERIQMLLSDPTSEPIGASPGKGAVGAWDHWNGTNG